MSGAFFWLASYPKSGNTWLRLFLANLSSPLEAVGINAIELGSLDNVRTRFDELIGTDSELLDQCTVDRLRASACRLLARRSSGRLYFKTHDAYDQDPDRCVFPPDCSEAAIYVVRNPFDLALSCAAFFNKSVDSAIDQLNDPDFALSSKSDRYQPLLRQQLGTWSDHVRGWMAVQDFPVLLVRYEDLVADPVTGFARIAAFAYPGIQPERVAIARDRTNFAELRAQERDEGFRENLSQAAPFFRSGKVGEWRTVLSQAQIDRIAEQHFDVATELGYLDSQGRPAC